MSISLKQAYDLFIFDRATYCKQKTIQNYKNTLSYFFKFLEGDRGCPISEIMLDSVTTMDLKKYVAGASTLARNKNYYKPQKCGLFYVKFYLFLCCTELYFIFICDIMRYETQL